MTFLGEEVLNWKSYSNNNFNNNNSYKWAWNIEDPTLTFCQSRLLCDCNNLNLEKLNAKITERITEIKFLSPSKGLFQFFQPHRWNNLAQFALGSAKACRYIYLNKELSSLARITGIPLDSLHRILYILWSSADKHNSQWTIRIHQSLNCRSPLAICGRKVVLTP